MAEIASPKATMTAPKITIGRIPMRSAIQPIRMPPDPVPIQTSEAAKATMDRSAPSSAAIGFSPTMRISGAP